MFKVNDYVMYATTGVCQVTEIKKEKLIGDTEEDYYVLCPVYQSNYTTIMTPVNNRKVVMRHLIDVCEVDALIAKIPTIDSPWIENDRQRNEKCKVALRSGDCEELITLLSILKARKKDRLAEGKKFAPVDESYMRLAEKLLHEEFSISLNIPLEKVKAYILKSCPEPVED